MNQSGLGYVSGKITRKLLLGLLVLLFSSALYGADGLFWRIQHQGQTVGYLLGTIHSEDPRVLEFSDALNEAMESSHFYAMELVPDLPTLASLTQRMHYQDGTTLDQVVGQELYEQVINALSGYLMPREILARMKPWAAMMTLSTPPPESGFFMDLSLSLRAAGQGVKVIGLETLDEQLSFLEHMPMDDQIELLSKAVQEYGDVEQVHAELVETYLLADLDELQQVADQQTSELDPALAQYFMDEGIDARNIRMSKVLVSKLDTEARVFAAVGALHLPGQKGLLNLLKKEGYTLKPMPSPFIAP